MMLNDVETVCLFVCGGGGGGLHVCIKEEEEEEASIFLF
jgi:hypothetical protein